jgi:hypothetical protein
MLDDRDFNHLVGAWVGEVGTLHAEIKNLPTEIDKVFKSTREKVDAFCVAVPIEISKTETIVSGLRNSLPNLADKEMKRAGDAAIEALAERVAEIANKVAGDAAAVERNKSYIRAVGFLSALLLVAGLVFGGGGYFLTRASAALIVKIAEKDLADANLLLENEKNRVDEKIVELEKRSAAETAKNSAAIGWAATRNGRLAKAFFDLGDGEAVATCGGTYLEKQIDNEKKTWCYAKRPELFGGKDNEVKDRWRIP